MKMPAQLPASQPASQQWQIKHHILPRPLPALPPLGQQSNSSAAPLCRRCCAGCCPVMAPAGRGLWAASAPSCAQGLHAALQGGLLAVLPGGRSQVAFTAATSAWRGQRHWCDTLPACTSTWHVCMPVCACVLCTCSCMCTSAPPHLSDLVYVCAVCCVLWTPLLPVASCCSRRCCCCQYCD